MENSDDSLYIPLSKMKREANRMFNIDYFYAAYTYVGAFMLASVFLFLRNAEGDVTIGFISLVGAVVILLLALSVRKSFNEMQRISDTNPLGLRLTPQGISFNIALLVFAKKDFSTKSPVVSLTWSELEEIWVETGGLFKRTTRRFSDSRYHPLYRPAVYHFIKKRDSQKQEKRSWRNLEDDPRQYQIYRDPLREYEQEIVNYMRRHVVLVLVEPQKS